ncbi:MAG TPA: phosphoenolpyruvate--protein phosphotransferase [Propionibacteriaceae bacterium]|nr:phosphoenolpyruvate--protein phosphotransferase [Propionibacteriaceae bacterium]
MSRHLRELRGVGVGSRGAVGPAVRVNPAPGVPADEPRPASADDRARDVARLEAALTSVTRDLDAAAALHEGETLGDVLLATSQMAEDPALLSESIALVEAGMGPAHAITQVAGQFADLFVAAGGYLAERVSDLNSVRDRVVARLTGQPDPGLTDLAEPAVLIAHDLTPADTSTLDLAKILAICTEAGGPTAHTAIIARQLGLPCVVQVAGLMEIPEGTLLAVESSSGTVTIEPDISVQARISERAARNTIFDADLEPATTSDGHRIPLLANVGTVADGLSAGVAAVEGVGLLRTEVLFLGASLEPSIEVQASAYAEVLQAFVGRKVVVRTLDAGADKPLAFATMPGEENPALGVRGYRLVRTLPNLIANQLEALGRASAAVPGTELWVMAPMIATLQEAADFAALARGAGLDKVGVMIEVPSAALRASQLLEVVDFVSLGTNDLGQYTMAADRMAGELSDILDMWQPAVLDLVAMTASAGIASGRPVGVCGESASDPLMALVLTGLGVTSLSMSTSALGEVRYALRHTSLDTCQAMARAALAAGSPTEARDAAAALLSDDLGHMLDL